MHRSAHARRRCVRCSRSAGRSKHWRWRTLRTWRRRLHFAPPSVKIVGSSAQSTPATTLSAKRARMPVSERSRPPRPSRRLDPKECELWMTRFEARACVERWPIASKARFEVFSTATAAAAGRRVGHPAPPTYLFRSPNSRGSEARTRSNGSSCPTRNTGARHSAQTVVLRRLG